MAAREKGGRVVFIGNIPYGVSEEQICEIFGRVGTVVNFRLVYDKETSRPKGFGFLEYTDVDAAASAVRNLNEFEIMGRTLRVDYSNDNSGGKSKGGEMEGSGRAPPPAGRFDGGAPPNGADPAAIPPLPPGVPLQDGLSAPDAISKTLATIPAPQLLDFISQMKTMTTVNPAQATAVLAQAPQLGYAIFQALLLLGLVDTNILGSLITQTSQAPAPQQPPPQQPPPQQIPQHPPPMPYGAPPPQMPPQGLPPYGQPAQPAYGTPLPPVGYPPPQPQGYPPQGYAPTPPAQPPAYQPPPQQYPPQQAPPPQQAAGPLGGAGQDQQQLLQTILQMSREQVMALDDTARAQVIELRRQLNAPI
jgi:cleavage stimulation factor subunit 2